MGKTCRGYDMFDVMPLGDELPESSAAQLVDWDVDTVGADGPPKNYYHFVIAMHKQTPTRVAPPPPAGFFLSPTSAFTPVVASTSPRPSLLSPSTPQTPTFGIKTLKLPTVCSTVDQDYGQQPSTSFSTLGLPSAFSPLVTPSTSAESNSLEPSTPKPQEKKSYTVKRSFLMVLRAHPTRRRIHEAMLQLFPDLTGYASVSLTQKIRQRKQNKRSHVVNAISTPAKPAVQPLKPTADDHIRPKTTPTATVKAQILSKTALKSERNPAIPKVKQQQMKKKVTFAMPWPRFF